MMRRSTNLVLSYASALFYSSGDDLSSIRKEVRSLLAFLKKKNDFLSYLRYPGVSPTEKKDLILSIRKNLSQDLINFVMVVITNKRSSLLVSILDKFLYLVMKSTNELEITIKSAETLQKSDIKIITESLNFLGKITKVNNVVDPSILGGFIVRYGFNLIDASLKSYLDELVNLSKTEILKIGKIAYEK